ncbi:MAG: hypothetical protein IJ486_00315 [Firmicutes bacterium]|nr:hypothetical protein [Bacillota bacterium]
MNYCENSLHQLEYLNRSKERLKAELEQLPDGELNRKSAKGREYCYAQIGENRIALKDDPKLLQQYLRKEQLENQIRNIEHNIPIIEKALKNYIPLTPLDSCWEKLKAEQNPYRPGDKQSLYRGIYYRSKSEVTIAMLLDSYQIPYKYEVEVYINEYKNRYPDFCIERPRDKKIIYWEHCGVIAKETYRHDLFYKLGDYHSIGIDLWDNLVLSFDQFDGGIDTTTIENLIHLYLL